MVSPVALQQEGAGVKSGSLHVLPVSVWIFSGYSGFPQ